MIFWFRVIDVLAHRLLRKKTIKRIDWYFEINKFHSHLLFVFSNILNFLIGVFRVTFFRVEFSNFQTFSDLPPKSGGKSLKHWKSEDSTSENNRQKSTVIMKFSNIRTFVDYLYDYFRYISSICKSFYFFYFYTPDLHSSWHLLHPFIYLLHVYILWTRHNDKEKKLRYFHRHFLWHSETSCCV